MKIRCVYPKIPCARTVAGVFEKMGVSEEDAAIGANTLTMTDLRGVETHGVSNILRAYVQQYNEGSLNSQPNWRIISEAPATAVMDADKGLAVILGPKAMQMAIDKARDVGIGVVTMFNAGHSGGIGHHAMLAAEQDMIWLCHHRRRRSGRPHIRLHRAARHQSHRARRARRDRTSLPLRRRHLQCRRQQARTCPQGSALLFCPAGLPSRTALPSWRRPTCADAENTGICPLAAPARWVPTRGYGLALMSEVLGTMLSGALPSMVDSDGGSKQSFAAYNIAAFTDVDEFKEKMDRMLRLLKETPPAPGHDRVLYPGLSEYEEIQDRRENGIPLHKEVIEWFDDICSELSVPRLRVLG